MLLIIIVIGSIVLITLFAVDARDKSKARSKVGLANQAARRRIRDGSSPDDIGIDEGTGQVITEEDIDAQEEIEEDLVDEDGEIGNPKEYPPTSKAFMYVCVNPIIRYGFSSNPFSKLECTQLNYFSRDGQIWASGQGGVEVPLQFKGINW